MDLSIQNDLKAAAADPAVDPEKQREAKRLREACGAVEGMFVTILLKEGMKTQLDEDGEAAQNMEMFKEFAVEQVAQQLGQNGGMGIADLIYEQLSNE